jgi:hypothetical protein
MSEGVSTFRLYLMRGGYLVNFVLVGLGAWPALLNHTGPWDPVRGAAFSLYAALSTLSALGLRYPLNMVPLLLFLLFYKVVWLIAVAVPTWPALRGATREMAAAAVMDLIVIPWPYVFEHYVKNRGDRWRRRTRSMSPDAVQKPAAITAR